MTRFVMVPGAGGSAWYWHRVVPLLEERGHHAVAVELPAGDDGAGWAEYADAMVAAGEAAAEASGRASAPDDAPVLVAQSMGAFTAPLVVDRLGARAIVLVNAMVPAPGETAGAWWEATGQAEAAAAAARAEGRPEEFDPVRDFFHDVPDDVRAAALSAREPSQSGTPFGQPWPLDAWPDVPTSGVAGSDDRLFPAAFQQRVARERLGIELDVVPGGHLVALSRPDVVLTAVLAGAEA